MAMVFGIFYLCHYLNFIIGFICNILSIKIKPFSVAIWNDERICQWLEERIIELDEDKDT